MSNPFALQVTPELMQRLVDDGEKKPRRKKQSKQQVESFSPISPLPTQEKSIEWHEPDAQQSPSGGGWPARDPYFTPFGHQAPFAGLFGGPPNADPLVADLKEELAPVYQAIQESEQIAQRLKKQGGNELKKVQEMARDLQEKQYRVPSHAPVCTNERGNCVQCYRENQKNPLLCSKLVQAFVKCARQAQEEFATSVLS